MNAIRQCIREMTGYLPGEPAKDESIIKLNQNESRYPASPRVLEAITAAAPLLPQYPESTSYNLRQAAAKIYNLPIDHIMAGNGSDDILRILFQCCCDPGDLAVAFYPSYTYYATLAAMYDAQYSLIDFEGEFSIPDRLDLSLAKLVFIPNPNAPTGTVFPESELRRLIKATPNGVVVIDEAYADFSGQTALQLVQEFDRVVVVRTFSKSYGLAGLRVGLGFARPELLAQMEKVRDYYNLDRLAQAGAQAALLDQEWLRHTCEKTIATRDGVTAVLRTMGLTVYDSGANFILIRFSGAPQAQDVFTRLRERNILVRYFNSRGLDACLRVSIGTQEDMDAFCQQMEDILQP